jgi:hypothetical protein
MGKKFKRIRRKRWCWQAQQKRMADSGTALKAL